MGALYKRVFDSWSDLQTFLTARGFTIANNKITYAQTPNTSLCYWSYNAAGTVNFVNSQGENAFRHNLTDFANNKKCGCIFLELADNGFVLYLSPVALDFSVTDLTFCCTNNYHQENHVLPNEHSEIVDDDNPLENGLVIVTPTDEDGKWHFTWRDKTPDLTVTYKLDPNDNTQEIVDTSASTTDNFSFDVDNTNGNITVGVEIPKTKMIPAPLTVTLTKAYLDQGVWSKYLYTQVLGQVDPPGNVFKINGQKFISFSDNEIWRCPVVKLPPTEVTQNDSSSTEQYYPTKTYKVGDYCINEGLLWKCRIAVTVPSPFDQTYWVVTTVPLELSNS